MVLLLDESDGRCCCGIIYIPLLVVAGILLSLFNSIGGWPGLLAALLVAGVLYFVWFESTKHDPVPTDQGAEPELATPADPDDSAGTEVRERQDA